MKLLKIILITISSFFLLNISVYAQQMMPGVQSPASFPVNQDLYNKGVAPVIQDVEGLRAEFKQDTQDPVTKVVKFEMTLKSTIDSDRVKITWTASGPNTFTDQTQVIRNGAVTNGGTYTIPIELTITGAGINELFGTVEVFKADSTYIATVRKDFASNADGEVLPITSDYTNAKTFSLIKTIVIAVILVAAILLVGFVGVKGFAKWLNRDEVK